MFFRAGIDPCIAAKLLAAPLSGIFVSYSSELLDMTTQGLRIFALPLFSAKKALRSKGAECLGFAVVTVRGRPRW